MRSSFTRGNLPLFTWAALLLAAIVVAAFQLSKNDTWVRSNVFELLPASEYDPLREQATRVVDEQLGTRLLFFLGHANRDAAKEAANVLGSTLTEISLLESVTTRIDESQFAAVGTFYYRYRSRLLSDDQLRQIEDDPEAIVTAAMARLYSPFGSAGDLATDPFFLFPDSLEALQPAGNAAHHADQPHAEEGGIAEERAERMRGAGVCVHGYHNLATGR